MNSSSFSQNRRQFIQSVTFGTVALATGSRAFATGDASTPHDVSLANDQFELLASYGDGMRCRLTHKPTGLVLADAPYSYSFANPVFTAASVGTNSLTLSGKNADGLGVTHRFTLRPEFSAIDEQITIQNGTGKALEAPFRAGFVIPLSGEAAQGGYVVTAVPFRREPSSVNGQNDDYSLDEVLNQPGRCLFGGQTNTGRSGYASEGWVVTDGSHGFMIAKFNPMAREWAILDRVPLENGVTGLRWGGAGAAAGYPDPVYELPAGATQVFGVTRLAAFQGKLTQGYYAFRAAMDSWNQCVPKDFDPPVHWNELYDNKLWSTQDPGGQDSPVNRKKYYCLPDMKFAASRAKEIGCQALYMDPGWDTNFASKIWDESRLGKLTDFVAMLKNDYGLKLSLHTPLSGWCNPSSYPADCFQCREDGKTSTGGLCGASRQYVDETARRLNVLADAGATFFMFDGTGAHGPCWNPNHGHQVPSTNVEHVDQTNRIGRLVHEKHPDVLIEMHDQLLGPGPFRNVPIYYGYRRHDFEPMGFNTVWAFELMWSPMEDLMTGHSVALYYYNLAYSLPLYIHIDLRGDNAEALMFWWNASTCRHLGMGGTAGDPATRNAQLASMKTYRRLKPYFTAGTFYGIDEQTHVHRHPGQNAAVINCFNLSVSPAQKEVRFDPAAFGLDPAREYKFIGASFEKAGGTYVGKPAVAAWGHTLVEVTPA